MRLGHLACVATRMLRITPCAHGALSYKTQAQDALELPSVWKRIPIHINQLLRRYVRVTLRRGNA